MDIIKGSVLDYPETPYVELLGRSYFSFLQGASSPEEMVLQAQELGYRGLALCDLNGLYGVVRAHRQAHHNSSFASPSDFASSAQAKSFQLIVGSELKLKDGGSVALLPMNREGYTRLCQLITQVQRPSQKGFSLFHLELLAQHSDDLIALALPPWNMDELKFLHQQFHDRLYLALWRDLSWQSRQFEHQAFELERHLGLQLVATQRPFMHEAQRKPLFDVLTCSLHRVSLAEAKTRLLHNSERHLKPLRQLKQLWQDRPDLLERTLEIAQRICFSLDELKYQYPKAAVPPGFNSSSYLRDLVRRGTLWRFPQGPTAAVQSLIDKEMALIEELQYEDYFITLWDICEFARKQSILFQGRGSAANSVVCYVLGLTAVNPEQIDLLFERFISRERGEPPDIDIDFESDRREEVLQYVYKKYGADHAAMVCTVICFRTKMALREVALALGIDLKSVGKIVQSMGKEGLSALVQMNESNLQLSLSNWGITQTQFQLLIDLTRQMYGFPRHLGIHTGGFVITQRPLSECVPVEKSSMVDRYVVQWNKDDLESLKMMKIDLLGLGMLSALNKSFALLKEKRNCSLSLATIPPDDSKTYKMIQQAQTVGVFQIESRAQMSLLPRLLPKCFYDLVVEVAIVRPGPIQGGMVHPYIRRRHGLEPVHYAHPDLKPILSKTYGVPIFQEQIMQIASTVCGFTPGEADELRRLMSSSWKDASLMQGLRQRLINGMLQHGIQMEFAEQVYKTIVGFSSYGFPESHAASFALLTYASSYLKAHHPDVFVCALLNSQPMGFYSPRVLIAEAQRSGVPFLPLDVQHSDYDYALEGPAVRVGFRAIYGLNKKFIQQLIANRQRHGPFSSLENFVERIHWPKSALMHLASSGALACFGLSPRAALWKIRSMNLERESFFYTQSPVYEQGPDLLPQESEWESMHREYRTQGYSLSSHPIQILRPHFQSTKGSARHSLQGHNSLSIKKLRSGQPVTLIGLLASYQKPPTAKGFVFLTLEDEFGLFNVALNPQVHLRFRQTLNANPLLKISGCIESHSSGLTHLKAKEVHPLLP